jgi:hypothetical protein
MSAPTPTYRRAHYAGHNYHASYARGNSTPTAIWRQHGKQWRPIPLARCPIPVRVVLSTPLHSNEATQ